MFRKTKLTAALICAAVFLIVSTVPTQARWHPRRHHHTGFNIRLGLGFGISLPRIHYRSYRYQPHAGYKTYRYQRRVVNSEWLWKKGYSDGYRQGQRITSRGLHSRYVYNYNYKYKHIKYYREGYRQGYAKGIKDRMHHRRGRYSPRY